MAINQLSLYWVKVCEGLWTILLSYLVMDPSQMFAVATPSEQAEGIGGGQPIFYSGDDAHGDWYLSGSRGIPAFPSISEIVAATAETKEDAHREENGACLEIELDHSPGGINELDNLVAMLEWTSLGYPDKKSFEQFLPNTSRDLCEGKVSPEDVSAGFVDVYYQYKDSGYLRGVGGMGIDHLDVMCLSAHASRVALPRKFFRLAGRQDLESTIMQQLAADTHIRFMQMASSGHTESEDKPSVETLLKNSVDAACEKCSDDFDRELFRGKRGRFLTKCPLYGIGSRRFCELAMSDEAGEADGPVLTWGGIEMSNPAAIVYSCILGIANEMAQGFLYDKHICWECRKYFDDNLQVCSRYSVAGYCSRHCQVVAWRDGHDVVCESLKKGYQLFQEALAVVDNAHKPGSMIERELGFSPNCLVDYPLIESILVYPADELFLVDMEKRCGYSSMQDFYANLIKVVANGEWWFSEEVSDATVFHPLPTCFRDQMKDIKHVDSIGRLMSYSLDATSPGKECLGSCMEQLDQKYGSHMSASKFIDIYKRGGITGPDETYRVRRNMVYSTKQWLMDNCHKRHARK